MKNWIVVILGLTIANFLWQLLNERDWSTALERSFFQLWAVVAVILAHPWR